MDAIPLETSMIVVLNSKVLGRNMKDGGLGMNLLHIYTSLSNDIVKPWEMLNI